MEFNFSQMSDAELESRAAAIITESEAEGADLEALQAEARALAAEREARAAEQQRVERRQAIANGLGTVIRRFEEETNMPERRMSVDSPEYRSAFLRTLNYEELGAEERAAFVATTGNTSAPLPTTMLNQIWDLVSKRHSILDNITIYRTGTVIEVVKHTAITAGAAKNVAEGAANDDENNTFVKVTLAGKDFSKHVDISYAFGMMSIDALESYLVQEISNGLADAMAADVVAQIGTDMDSGNKLTSAAAGTLSFTDVAGAFAALVRAENIAVYGTRKTIYTYLVGMVDANKRPIFQMNAQDGAEGSLIGAQVRVEDAVADGVLLIGDASKVVFNMVQDVMIETDRDIKKHVITHSGYARGQGALVANKAFAQLTVKTA